ncbi:hypothetical protein NCAS_0H00900 [Naumovozyma castellii]|uniref:RNA polymerase I-specific transcription initiation factor RRN11 n=1 Tax=Naumovozyma castellii TaxID=27288 RepID=G0VIS3_NAUCA|nr:hypothetical protein NCAS_0H00900 [Naumovozyma castellii CBS 4309]CCC71400.1 hypothetical protein NCAS_0H00900 [Naumovozyma castellii CBS 4309]
MFDLPTQISNKRIANERKIRYTYINQLSRKYNRQDAESSSLPTPENSASESHESTGEDEEVRRRRLKRRWKNVIGEAVSDTDEDEDGEEEREDEGPENQERRFFKTHEKPQESYEIWSTDNNKRMPLQKKFISFSKLNKIEKSTKRRMQGSLLHSSKFNNICFESISQGQELVTPLHTPESFTLKHIENLTNLLHINVMKGKWEVAYKIFALMVRIPKVDIRSIWGIGVKILSQRAATTTLDFLVWMNSVYSSRINYIQGMTHRVDPVFRSGSKTHSSKFTITWLWKSLIYCTDTDNDEDIDSDYGGFGRDKLQILIEKVSELVLIPPFMEDAEVWFIYALCHMVKADQLSLNFNLNQSNGSARDIARNEVIQNIQLVKTFLQTAMSKGHFEYPERFITRQLNTFEERLYSKDETNSKDKDNNESDNGSSMDNGNIQLVPETNPIPPAEDEYVFSDFSFTNAAHDLDTQALEPMIHEEDLMEEDPFSQIQSDSSE